MTASTDTAELMGAPTDVLPGKGHFPWFEDSGCVRRSLDRLLAAWYNHIRWTVRRHPIRPTGREACVQSPPEVVARSFAVVSITHGRLGRLLLQPWLRVWNPSTRTVAVFRGASPPTHAAG